MNRTLFPSRLRWLLAVATLLVAACGGGGGGGGGGIAFPPVAPPAPAPSEGSATIGPAGGVVEGPDGTRITVPPGALREPVTLRIARDSSGATPLPAGAQRLSAVYALTPHGQQFDLPVEIRLPFDAAALPAGMAPPVLMSQPGEPWISEPVDEVKQDGAALRFLTSHFSYAVASCYGPCPQSAPWFAGELLGSYQLEPAQAAPGQPQRKVIDHAGTYVARITALPRAYQPGTNRNWCAGPVALRLYRTEGTMGARVLFATHQLNGPASIDVPIVLDHTHNGPRGIYFEWNCRTASGWPEGTAIAYSPNPLIGIAGMDVRIPVPLDAPLITRQPVDATADAGQSAAFSIEATTANSLFIQWERSDDGGTTWRNVGTGPDLTVPNVQAADQGALFRAQVCNQRGLVLNCITSSTVRINYTGPLMPSITQAPQGIAVVVGQTASFTVTASGQPAPALTWFRRNAGGDVQVGTGASYVTAPTALADDGARFYAVAANSAGQATSADAVLTVTAAAQVPSVSAITATPGLSITACGSVSLTVTATGTAPLSYQWRRNGAALVDGNQPDTCNGAPATVSGAGSTTLVLGNVPVGWSGQSIDLVASNGAGSTPASAVTLTITAPPAGLGWSAGSTVTMANGGDLPAAPVTRSDSTVQWYGSSDAWALFQQNAASVWAGRYRGANGTNGPFGRWDAPEMLSTAGTLATAIGVASDDTGRAVALWVTASAAGGGVPVANLWMRHHDGTAWGAPQRVDDGGAAGLFMGPLPWRHVRIVRSGPHALVVWTGTGVGTGARVVSARRIRLDNGTAEASSDLTGGYSPPALDDAAEKPPIHLSATAQGAAMAWWIDVDGLIHPSRYDPASGQWTTTHSTGTSAPTGAVLTLDGTGQSWMAKVGLTGLEVFSLAPGATNWITRGVLNPAITAEATTVRLGADGAGNVVVVWACHDCPNARPDMNNAPLYGTRFDAASGNWRTTERLDAPLGTDVFTDMNDFQLRMNAAGDAALLWSNSPTLAPDGSGVAVRVHARHFAAGATGWSAITQLSAPGGGEQQSPTLALASGSLRTLALWEQTPTGGGTSATGWAVYQP